VALEHLRSDFERRIGVVQTRVTLSAKHPRFKPLFQEALSLSRAERSVTLPLGRLNHAGESNKIAVPLFPAGFFWVGYRLSIPVVAVRSDSFLETVFRFSVIVLPTVPVVAGGSGPPGRVWEGATAPLPIEHAVSEANSFLGGLGGVFAPFCCIAADGVSRTRVSSLLSEIAICKDIRI
jgi:hypothetical protein